MPSNRMSIRSSIDLFFRSAFARSYPRIWGIKREPMWITFDTIVPIINVTVFVYLYKTLNAPEAFLGYVIIGGSLISYWHNVVWMMASQLYWDKRGGYLELFVMAPAPLMGILFGMAAGGFVMSTARTVMILVVASLLFQIHYDLSQWPMLLALFFAMIVALYGLGMVLSSVFLYWGREAWQLALTLHEPVYLLSGMNFPVARLLATLPGILTFVSAAIPLTFGMDGLRQLLFPNAAEGLLNPEIELLLLIGESIAFVTLAYFATRYMEKLARSGATLSLRWQ